jgi:hypothetical protein
MPLLLLVLGLVTAAVGVILAGAGAFGATEADVLTPGMTAIVGGLLLVGLWIAVRELQRIERALSGSRPLRAAADARTSSDVLAARLPVTAKPKVDSKTEPKIEAKNELKNEAKVELEPEEKNDAKAKPQPAPAVADAATSAEEAASERLRLKFPNIRRVENDPVVAPADVSLAPPDRVEEAPVEEKVPASVARAPQIGSPLARPAPRLEPKLKAGEKTNGAAPKGFWPVGRKREAPQVTRTAPPVFPPVVEPPPAEPVPIAEAPAAVETAAPVPVSVLKSGVVEGMAYTLYSDGSIEAQFPQGMLRFGSIAELRAHIESAT